MNLDAVVKELHQIVREKTPKGLLRNSFLSDYGLPSRP
jgi:hypothetical protein